MAFSDISLARNYVYPHMKVLKNKHNIMSTKKLADECKRYAKKVMINLNKEPLPQEFDSSYLKYIHQRLFESTFEWAGYTRDLSFTFDDGTVAEMPMMKVPDSDIFYVQGKNIQESLKKFDQLLASKNNLQGLSREEFIDEAVKLFAFLNSIAPFRAGNEPTQQIFFEKLAKAAGHQLDFSVTTEKRIMRACIDSMTLEGDGAHKEMKLLFEDISDPQKIIVLKDFIRRIPGLERERLNDEYVIMAKEGITYTGIYKISTVNSVIIETADSHVLCVKDYFPPEQLRTLKPGDVCTVTVPIDIDQILIPAEKMAPLKEEEIIRKVSRTNCIKESQKEIDYLLKFVYRDITVLDEQIMCIYKCPETSKQLSEQIRKSPQAFGKLAGFKVFGIRSPKRRRAERNIEKLTSEIEKHGEIVKNVKDEISLEFEKDQKRVGQVVKKASKKIQDILNLPKDEQKNALEASPLLYEELRSFLNEVNSRLSAREKDYICDYHDKKLAESIGVSEMHAMTIIKTVNKSAKLCKQFEKIKEKIKKVDCSEIMAMAV
ncbi:Bartonella effector protein Bep8 [Bartonella sp. A1379B]|uniref:BID domain-containing T4SS effector n=1 Tax=Bartonella sp. A1379B TaxID=1933910 RepID=UPI00099A2A9D|nr:BID domain-containing T4SS effector [Bartonella sp. A1379B]AQX18476.1 Bartonella effector protein Bep8 [Bartonella sp. A1379B]